MKEEIQKLEAKMQELHENKVSLTSSLANISSSMTPYSSLSTKSKAYQNHLQDSTAKNEQIHQLEAIRAENERLKLQLELRTQELNSKSVEANKMLSARDDEIGQLKIKLDCHERNDRLLRKRVLDLTVPMATPGEETEVKPKAKTNVLKKNEQISKLTCDTDEKLPRKQSKTIPKLKDQLQVMFTSHCELSFSQLATRAFYLQLYILHNI